MAGIEKVCEFSGDYPGWAMYNHKRNHIQIMPKYRKLFRGHEAVLYVFKRQMVIDLNPGHMSTDLACVNPNPTEYDWRSGAADRAVSFVNGVKDVYSVFYDNVDEYKAALKKRHQRLLMEYEYMLYVPSLPGEVDGCYINYSTDMPSVIRRLRRLVGSRNLTVKYKEGDCWNFLDRQLLPE